MLDKKVVSQCVSADYCRGWNDAVDATPRWIPAEERLPKGEVLALSDRGTMHIGYIEYHTYGGVRMCMCEDYDSGIAMSGVTHWMPLPEPPEEE